MLHRLWQINLYHPWASVLSLLVIIVLTTYANVSWLTPNNAPRVYLPENQPTVEYHEKLMDSFPRYETTIGIFKPPKLLSKSFLQRLERLREEVENHPLVDKVHTLTSVDHISSTSDGFSISPLIDIEKLDEKSSDYWERRIISDRFAMNRFVDKSLSETTLIIFPKKVESTLLRLKILRHFEDSVKRNNLSSDLIGVTGVLPQDTAQFTIMQKDNARLIPILLLLTFFLIFYLYRRWTLLLFTSLIVFSTLSSTISIYSLSGLPFNSISSITGPLLMALTTSLLLHIFNSIYSTVPLENSYKESIKSAFYKLAVPSFFIMITTAAGLLSLCLSPVPAVQSFGWISAVGISLTYFYTMLFLPAMLIQWSSRKKQNEVKSHFEMINKLLRGANHLALRKPVHVLLSISLLCGFAISQIPKIKVETNFLKFFEDDHEINQATDHLDAHFFGTATGLVAFEAQDVDRFKDPDFLKKVNKVEEWLSNQPEVDRTISLVDFIEEMNQSFHGGKDRFEKVPDSQSLISQYLFIYSGDDLYDFVNRDFNLAQININTSAYGVNEGEAFLKRLRHFLSEIDWKGIKWSTNGYIQIISEQENLLVKGQLRSLFGALALIFLFLVISTRSFSNGMLCLIPNTAPVIFIFGLMGAAGIWLNMGTALVASLVVGVAVDDTIHMFHRFQHNRSRGTRISWALARTNRDTGRAITITTLILGVQFLLLMTSNFIPLANFGLLSLTGVVAALLFDVLLLPALIIVLSKRIKI